MKHLHTIPVPAGMTAEESWAEITTMGKLVKPGAASWAVIECDGEECANVEHGDQDSLSVVALLPALTVRSILAEAMWDSQVAPFDKCRASAGLMIRWLDTHGYVLGRVIESGGHDDRTERN